MPMTRTTTHTLVAFTLVLLASLAIENARAEGPDYQSKYIAVGLSPVRPAFAWFAVDSLGQGKVRQNPILAPSDTNPMPGLERPDPFSYTLHGRPIWRVQCNRQGLTFSADFAAAAPPLLLEFNQRANHATLLGLMPAGQRRMALPCVLHLPDMGSVRITASAPGLVLDYDARRRHRAHRRRHRQTRPDKPPREQGCPLLLHFP
jgi:hypothetical protein